MVLLTLLIGPVAVAQLGDDPWQRLSLGTQLMEKYHDVNLVGARHGGRLKSWRKIQIVPRLMPVWIQTPSPRGRGRSGKPLFSPLALWERDRVRVIRATIAPGP